MQDVQVISGRLLNTVLYFNPSSILDGVIDKNSFVNVRLYLEYAPNSDDIEILIGGDCDDSAGFFVSPTFVLTNNPKSRIMREEISGPVITIYVYNEYEQEPAALQ